MHGAAGSKTGYGRTAEETDCGEDCGRQSGETQAVISILEGNIQSVISQKGEFSVEQIDARLNELQEQLLKKANSNEDYNELVEEIYQLRDLKKDVMIEDAEREGLRQRITEMATFLHQQPAEIIEYDEQLVRRLIERILVYEERYVVEFKSGMSVDIVK